MNICESVEDAERYADADKKRRDDAENPNAADGSCYEAEKQLANFADKLTDELKKRLEAALRETKEALLKKDVVLATDRAETLKKILKETGATRYTQTGQAEKGALLRRRAGKALRRSPMEEPQAHKPAPAATPPRARSWMPSTRKTNKNDKNHGAVATTRT